MSHRVHRAVSADGTEISGRVHGQGPPLVLVHAGLGDGDLDCGELASLLEDRFTCYLANTRNRGLSGDSDGVGAERDVEDLVAFIDGIGAPVGLATWSGGAIEALGAAARCAAVSAVAVHEPVVVEQMDEEDVSRFEAAVAHMAGLAEQGRLTEAARDWMVDWANAEELAALEASGYLEAAGRYVAVLLGQLARLDEDTGPGPTDPSELARIEAPVLVLQGSETTGRWLLEGVRHVAEHVADARIREVPGAGHSCMPAQPELLVDELVEFFAPRLAGVAGR